MPLCNLINKLWLSAESDLHTLGALFNTWQSSSVHTPHAVDASSLKGFQQGKSLSVIEFFFFVFHSCTANSRFISCIQCNYSTWCCYSEALSHVCRCVSCSPRTACCKQMLLHATPLRLCWLTHGWTTCLLPCCVLPDTGIYVTFDQIVSFHLSDAHRNLACAASCLPCLRIKSTAQLRHAKKANGSGGVVTAVLCE